MVWPFHNTSVENQHDAAPQFDIFILGTRGAGKTVFLSALYYLLSTDNGERGYFVRLPPSKSVELQRQVDILLDPSSNGWPSATPNQSEYTFEVVFCNKDPFRRIPIFKTRYFDYPGGWVSEGYDYSGFSVNEVAQRSHAILMLLDGKK